MTLRCGGVSRSGGNAGGQSSLTDRYGPDAARPRRMRNGAAGSPAGGDAKVSLMEKFNRSGYYRRVFPVILSQAGQILVQLVDNAMVGRLGAVPLAGVSFANAVFFMLFVLGTGMSLGLTPLVGEMYSVSNHRKSAAYLQNSILFYGCMGVCIFLLAMAVRPFMWHMGQSPEVVRQAVPYFGYVAVSVIPFMVFASFKQFLEGVGNTKVAMAIIITSNAINVVFNWLFIYGHWGFPEMGAAGAGLATLISRVLTPVLIIVYSLAGEAYKAGCSDFETFLPRA